jgi:hypothetical protein
LAGARATSRGSQDTGFYRRGRICRSSGTAAPWFVSLVRTNAFQKPIRWEADSKSLLGGRSRAQRLCSRCVLDESLSECSGQSIRSQQQRAARRQPTALPVLRPPAVWVLSNSPASQIETSRSEKPASFVVFRQRDLPEGKGDVWNGNLLCRLSLLRLHASEESLLEAVGIAAAAIGIPSH